MNKTPLSIFLIAATLICAPGSNLREQLATPGEVGVVMGHLHLASSSYPVHS
jgi:hypothetical protein